jgi:HK97 family phage major capsid protein
MEMKDLQVKLDELKSALEESLTKKAKAEIEAQIKTVSESIEALKAELGKPNAETAKTLKELTESLEAVKKAAELNQPVIDAFVHQKSQNQGAEQKAVTIEDAIAKAVTEAEDGIQKFIRKETKSLVLDLKEVGDITTGNVTGGSRYGQQLRPGIIEQQRRKVHVRDLVPVAAAGPGNEYTFMRENGDGEGAIAPTAETSTKPQIDIDLVESSVKFETLAGWLRLTRKAMRNIPGLISFLQSRLPEKLLRVEDQQLLYGDGNTPNIKGIGTSGNFTAADTTNGPLAEALIDAIAQLEDEEERDATGVLVRPKDYYNFFKNKATGSGEYDLPENFVFANGVLYISGVPVYASTAVTYGDYFVGDWRMGAQLLVQEGMRIEFFEQDGTNVRENKITVRIEETVAFPVFGNDYFIKGTDSDHS